MGWLVALFRSIAISVIPQIVQDAWDKRKKEEPPVTEPEQVDPPPATDSGPPTWREVQIKAILSKSTSRTTQAAVSISSKKTV